MSISVVCPECAVTIAVPEEVLGKKIRCKSCSEVFVATPTSVKKKTPPPRPTPNADAGPPKRTKATTPHVAADESDADDDAPRPRKKKKAPAKKTSRAPLVVLAVVVGIAILGGLTFTAYAAGLFGTGDDKTPNKSNNEVTQKDSKTQLPTKPPLVSELKIGDVPEMTEEMVDFGPIDVQSDGETFTVSIRYRITKPEMLHTAFRLVVVLPPGSTGSFVQPIYKLGAKGPEGTIKQVFGENFSQAEFWLGINRPVGGETVQPLRVSRILKQSRPG